MRMHLQHPACVVSVGGRDCLLHMLLSGYQKIKTGKVCALPLAGAGCVPASIPDEHVRCVQP